MSRWLDLSVLGIPELDKRLDELEKKAAMKAVRPALRDGMKAILPFVLALVPRRTGALARTIKVRAAKRKKGRVGAVIVTGTRDQLGIPADSPWYYPAHVELGTEHAPAESFMRAGLKAGEASGLQAVVSTLWKKLEALGMGQSTGDDGGEGEAA